MKSTLSRAGVTVAGVFLAFGASAVLATAANAEPAVADPIVAGTCIYAGQEYSEGAIIKVGDLYIQCVFGNWSRV
jgi:hypothetical protein